MKLIHCLCLMSLLALFAPRAQAQVTNFAIFKVTVYHQTNSAPQTVPDFPNAYYFGAQLNLYEDYYYVFADVFWNDAPTTSPGYCANMNENGPDNFTYSGPFYSDKDAFDGDFGSGLYEMDAEPNGSSDLDSGFLTVPDSDIYPTNIPAYTPESWCRMQEVDPARDMKLDLNSFDVFPGADEALTFINIYVPFLPVSGPTIYATNGVSLQLTNVYIPANTLQYGVTYRVDTFFSSRIDTPDAGFNDVESIVGFDDLTFTELTTVPPPLSIAACGTNVVVSWPSLASNFTLQTTTNLVDPASWNSVTNIYQPSGLTNSVVYPATGRNSFYRLTSEGVVNSGGGS